MHTRVIALGNPGTGKSTLLNTAIGRAEFESGISVGHGIMPNRQEVLADGVTYVDTPGLDDPEMRTQAAEYISNELSKGGDLKLVFVLKVDSLRVRSADQTTMNLILSALEKAGTKCSLRFSVVVNQLHKKELERIENNEDDQRKLLSFINSGYEVNHVGWFPFDFDALDMSGAVLQFRDEVLAFLDAAPFVTVKENTPISVDVSRFNEENEAQRELIAALESNAEMQKEQLARMEERYLQERQELQQFFNNANQNNQKQLRRMKIKRRAYTALSAVGGAVGGVGALAAAGFLV